MTFVNNGKTFPGLDDMACSNPCHDLLQFLPSFKNPIYLKIILITAGVSKSQIKNKKNRSIYKFVELLIPTLNKFISNQFLLSYFIGRGKS